MCFHPCIIILIVRNLPKDDYYYSFSSIFKIFLLITTRLISCFSFCIDSSLDATSFSFPITRGVFLSSKVSNESFCTFQAVFIWKTNHSVVSFEVFTVRNCSDSIYFADTSREKLIFFRHYEQHVFL